MTLIDFAVYGDSTSSRETAWLPFVDTKLVRHVGGVAIAGMNSAEILARTTKKVAADVTVIMLGTNDVADKLERRQTKANIAAIAAASGATRVLLCAIAPCDVIEDGLDRQSLGYALNRDLAQFAADNGWMFADPWSAVRVRTNGWASGASSDKVHPVEATSVNHTAPRMTLYIRQGASIPA